MKFILSRKIIFSGYNSLKSLQVFIAEIFVKEEVKTNIHKSSFLLRFSAEDMFPYPVPKTFITVLIS